MLSTKPYLIRAFYDWILDSECTPFIALNTNVPNCHVPTEHIENGEIIFNISPQAIRDLNISNDFIEFKASFSGVVQIVSAPVRALLAIYAEENGQGMFFDAEEEPAAGSDDWSSQQSVDKKSDTKSKDKKQVSHLRLVD